MQLKHVQLPMPIPDRRVKLETSIAPARPAEKLDVLSCYELRLSSSFLSRRLETLKLPK
jgi:hypothetical protein